VTVEDQLGGLREVFTWEPPNTSGSTGSTKISVPLSDETGPVRIRLVARGNGPAAHWLNPRIDGSGRTHAERTPAPFDESPPRLVILYVMDALRAHYVGHLGRRPKLTPTLDRLASQGITFTNHFAVAPNTPPSTRALFSGLVMLDDRQLPTPGPQRLAEVFRAAGYRTGSITGNPHLSPTLDLGVGFDHVELLRVAEDHHPDHPPTINSSAEILHEAALRWIDDLAAEECGFLYIHTMNPHNPYSPPQPFESRFAPVGGSTIDGRTRTLVSIRDGRADVGVDDIARLRQLYAAGVAYNDAELATLLQAIDERVDPRDVLVVVTSDHGEELFEHNGVLHGYTLYDEMLRIPLIIRWPARISPGEISDLANTLDLHATLVELAATSPVGTTGTALWPGILDRDAPTQNRQITFAAAPGLAGGVMARSPRWKLIMVPNEGIRRGQGKGRGRSFDLEYVFDLESDPNEQHNLAGTTELEVAWLRTRLKAWLEKQRELQPVPGDQVMDDETKDQLEALGYIVEP
jgi:arylsulfatase A-like enzyme